MNHQRFNLTPNNFRDSSGILDQSVSGSIPNMAGPGPSMPVTTGPPPVPPRRQIAPYQSYGDYRPYGSYLNNGYGYGSNWGYGRYGGLGYSSYPGYSSLYGQNQWAGLSGDIENRFVQYAEESTRPAFQSIEVMLHTFSSMTVMLESTFFAMRSSFQAIIGVAENMGKLRSMLKQFFNTFALIRFCKWLYWKVKYLLGIRNQDTTSENLWQQTITEVLNGAKENSGASSWPIFLFFSILFAMPYLIHKLMKNTKTNEIKVNNPKEWMERNEPVYTATALYDFTAATAEELSLKTGQKVWLAPQSMQPKNLPGWWRATDSINVGLIPSSYVTVVGQLKKKTEFSSNNNNCEPEPSTSQAFNSQSVVNSKSINISAKDTNQNCEDILKLNDKS